MKGPSPKRRFRSLLHSRVKLCRFISLAPDPVRHATVAAASRRRPALPDFGPAHRARARNEDRHDREGRESSGDEGE